MQETIDKVDVPGEAAELRKYIELYCTNISAALSKDSFVTTTKKFNSTSSKLKESETFAKAVQMMTSQSYLSHDKVSHAVTTTSLPYLMNRINESREETNRIVNTLKSMKSNVERRQYLLQQFAVCTLSGYHRKIASQSFESDLKVLHRRQKITLFTYFCVLFVPVYLVFVVLFVFLFGVSIGPEKSNLWLLSALTTILQELILMKPLFTWAKSIFLPSIVIDNVNNVYSNLKKRAKLVMLRHTGLLRTSNARIQHVCT
jgi:hypothetical protein